PHSHELGRPFAVADNRLGQLEHDLVHRPRQLGVFGTGQIVDLVHLRLAGGNQDAGIVGAGVAIDGNAVERQVGSLTQHMLQYRLGYPGVGGHIAQHGRHVRADHAGTLGDSGNGHCPATKTDLAAGTLGRVSVVMMPSAAWAQLPSARSARAWGSTAIILSAGSSSPMTPVLKGSTRTGSTPVRPASASQVRRAASMPGLPVPALALPVLTSR